MSHSLETIRAVFGRQYQAQRSLRQVHHGGEVESLAKEATRAADSEVVSLHGKSLLLRVTVFQRMGKAGG